MLTEPGKFSQLRWINVLSILISVALILCGLAFYGIEMVAAGGFLLLISIMFMAFVSLVVNMESTLAAQLSELRHLRETIHQQVATLDSIAENTRISDAAKSLTHRDREMEALRSAIRDDIGQGRWEAGLSLVDEIETRYGFKQEAEALREELDDARSRAIQAKLGKAIENIEVLFEANDWERAKGEIDRLMHALPGDARVASLLDRMQLLKDRHKEQLRKEWDEAVRRSDTDRAIEVLKELDRYLSSAEAHELQASAADVFKKKLIQLGLQFKFAVEEKRWQDALTAGLELIRSFPNARMATEVRDALETLKERARSVPERSTAETVPGGR